MIKLLALYTWALISGTLIAMALALHGCHLASRDQSLQSLVISQAATVGVLLGAITLIGHHTEIIGNPLPLATGLFVAALCYFLGERLARNRRSTKTNIFLALFTILLALNYWLVSYFPALESHLAQAFFGDIVTISGLAMWIASSMAIVTLALLIPGWKSVANHSFVQPIIGGSHLTKNYSIKLFNVLTLLLVTISVYSMGLLFTVAYLLIPTVIFSYTRKASVRLHMVLVVFLAAISLVLGFVLSLYFDRGSTVPTVVLTMLFVGILLLTIVNRILSPGKHTRAWLD